MPSSSSTTSSSSSSSASSATEEETTGGPVSNNTSVTGGGKTEPLIRSISNSHTHTNVLPTPTPTPTPATVMPPTPARVLESPPSVSTHKHAVAAGHDVHGGDHSAHRPRSAGDLAPPLHDTVVVTNSNNTNNNTIHDTNNHTNTAPHNTNDNNTCSTAHNTSNQSSTHSSLKSHHGTADAVHQLLGQDLHIDQRPPQSASPISFSLTPSDDPLEREAQLSKAQLLLLDEDDEFAGFTIVPSRRASTQLEVPFDLQALMNAQASSSTTHPLTTLAKLDEEKSSTSQSTHDLSDNASNREKDKDDEDGENDDAEESLILKHVDSFGNLQDASAPSASAHDTDTPCTTQSSVTTQLTNGESFQTPVKAEKEAHSSSEHSSVNIPPVTIGATNPHALESPPNYELKVHIIRGSLHGGGLRNLSHVEVRINDELIHTTASVAAPPIWNETARYFLPTLDFASPVMISLSLYKKRWTSSGYKLVGTTSVSLAELAETILNKHGIIEKEYNLNVSRWNLTLTGHLYLGFQLRSIVAEPTITSTDASSAVKAGGASRSVTPLKESAFTRRASFKHTGTTFAFKTRGIDPDDISDDDSDKDKNTTGKAALVSEQKVLIDETAKLLQEIIALIESFVNLETLQKTLQIVLDVVQIFVEILKTIDESVYLGIFITFIVYIAYNQNKQFVYVDLSIKKMDTVVDRMLQKLHSRSVQ